MADVSVRIAWPDDAASLARVQTSCWAAQYHDLLGDGAHLDPAATAATWHAALCKTTDARNRALVALDGNHVVGFVVTIPAADPDCDPGAVGEVVELLVEPAERSTGHGSRLLHAAVDTLVADRFSRAVTWVLTTDDTRRRFFTDAGWASDGASRELDLDGTGAVTVRQIRLHTAIG
ncbi:MAG: GNAT family N-acetyltransferase [Nocardioides sp.]